METLVNNLVENPMYAIYIAIGVVLYTLTVFGLYRSAVYYFGYYGGLVIAYSVGLPIVAIVFIYVLGKQIFVTIFGWPERYRNRRLLKEIFGIEKMGPDFINPNQTRVDKKLEILAISCKESFDEQEKARRRGEVYEKTEELIKNKRAFWSAHWLAKKNDFWVYSRIEQYYNFY